MRFNFSVSKVFPARRHATHSQTVSGLLYSTKAEWDTCGRTWCSITLHFGSAGQWHSYKQQSPQCRVLYRNIVFYYYPADPTCSNEKRKTTTNVGLLWHNGMWTVRLCEHMANHWVYYAIAPRLCWRGHSTLALPTTQSSQYSWLTRKPQSEILENLKWNESRNRRISLHK